MFTGIIEETGTIRNISHGVKSSRVTVEARKVLIDSKVGDSIATNGICLTVTQLGSDFLVMDVMPETIRQTSFKHLKPGSQVNLERALRPIDRLGGHLVSGHIDGTGTISDRTEEDIAVWLTITADQNILHYIIDKGSVTIDGISLTVTAVSKNYFKVSIIPHTQAITTLQHKQKGDLVNIECDLVGKYIEKFLKGSAEGPEKQKIDIDFLSKHNFL